MFSFKPSHSTGRVNKCLYPMKPEYFYIPMVSCWTDMTLMLISALNTALIRLGYNFNISYLLYPLFHMVILISLLLKIKCYKGMRTMIIHQFRNVLKKHWEAVSKYVSYIFKTAKCKVISPIPISILGHHILCHFFLFIDARVKF